MKSRCGPIRTCSNMRVEKSTEALAAACRRDAGAQLLGRQPGRRSACHVLDKVEYAALMTRAAEQAMVVVEKPKKAG